MTRRWQFLLATLGYLLFVVYGSLVPLEFVPLHWDEARARFARIPYLELRVASRADWVANLLLFIPLAYLWAGALWRCGRTAWNALALSAVVLVGAALSVAIEFVQLYFPQRTVSINDIVAEAAGAVIGVLLWWSTGEPLLRWLEAGARERNPTGWTERVLYVYLAVFCAYSVLPLDLTISPIEIYHKWNAGKVLLVPFSATYTSTANAVYDMGGDVLIWIPVAVLWRISGRLSPLEVWLRVTMAALLLEVLQLFVYSRVTDTTDVLMAMVGGLIGVMLGGRLAAHADMPVDRQRSSRAWRLWALAFAVWLAIIALVFWYPFEVRVERIFVTDRLRQLWRVPFMTYYFGSEYRHRRDEPS